MSSEPKPEPSSPKSVIRLKLPFIRCSTCGPVASAHFRRPRQLKARAMNTEFTQFRAPSRSLATALAGCGLGILLAVLPSTVFADDASAEPAPQKATSKASWTQWGGIDHAFKAESSGLKNSWPETGPPKLWERDLGEGYSAILVEDGKLYTQYRIDEKEAVAALDAASGKTLWERRYEASPAEGHVDQFGRGPRATPLLVGDQLFTIGVSGVLNCLDKKTGEIQWSKDLWKDMGGSVLNHGYSSSPIAYKDQVIVLVGGEGHSIVSFNRKDGSVKWQNQDFKNSYSTPKIFEIDGKDHLITFMAHQIVGLDPSNGALEWSYDHQNQWEQNINMPVLVDGQYLFFSASQAGARGVKLSRTDGKVQAEELWSTRKIQFYHVTSVLEGDYVYGSTGSGSPAFMAAVNVKTGEIAWRKRGYAKANVIQADGKLFILDENGVLTMSEANPEDLKVLAQVELLERPAWTVPTIIGKTMYVRGNGKIMALNLG